MGEFDLIRRHFMRKARRVALGVGDDCALLAPAAGHQLAVSCDMLVEGRHFLSTVAPDRLAHKALAVNLSDLAACGARPLAFTLALALPRADDSFLLPFAAGLWALADAHQVDLIGGDTTAGPLNLCITVFGEVPVGGALLRNGARPGDRIWVSGKLGDARLALEAFRGTVSLPGLEFDAVRLAMEMPTPRIALGLALRGLATSAIDLSDGLLGDLGHVLAASGVGAAVEIEAIPRSDALRRQDADLQQRCLLTGGDDYELLFTAPASADGAVQAAARSAGVAVAAIGLIEATSGLRVVDATSRPVRPTERPFDHFSD